GRALHVGDLLLRAFGGLEPNGQLVVATRNGSPTATATPLRRLNVPGSGTVGQFGTVNGKNKKLAFAEADGTAVRISLKGGTGTAFYDGTNVDLVLSGTSAGSALVVKARGGSDGRVSLRDIRADGGLKSFTCKNADVTGTFFVNGPLGKVLLGTLSGTLAATGSIGSLATSGGLSSAMVLAGANLGTDGKLGGGDDAFAAASIGRIAVKGAVATSTMEAGVNPTNGAFGDSDDQLAGGGSTIRQIVVKGGTDQQSRFIAGSIGKAKLPENAVPGTDPRLIVLT
ncbi:MAG TPA: hypothetical protein VL371_19550, partial [Gemmataceae bacterium]|nr:hypothetical protein [Gemmataceae bacterium]